MLEENIMHFFCINLSHGFLFYVLIFSKLYNMPVTWGMGKCWLRWYSISTNLPPISQEDSQKAFHILF